MQTVRRVAPWAVAALAGAMVADLAETFVDPANSDSAARIYAAAEQHQAAWWARPCCCW